MIFQGCGGDLNEWVDGISNLLRDEMIVPSDFTFKEVYKFNNRDCTNLVFDLNNKDINMGKLAILRLNMKQEFGAMWLSDYIDNYLNCNISF